MHISCVCGKHTTGGAILLGLILARAHVCLASPACDLAGAIPPGLILVRAHVCLASPACDRAGDARWRYAAKTILPSSVDLVERRFENKRVVCREVGVWTPREGSRVTRTKHIHFLLWLSKHRAYNFVSAVECTSTRRIDMHNFVCSLTSTRHKHVLVCSFSHTCTFSASVVGIFLRCEFWIYSIHSPLFHVPGRRSSNGRVAELNGRASVYGIVVLHNGTQRQLWQRLPKLTEFHFYQRWSFA